MTRAVTLKDRIETLLTAATFAEAGEPGMAGDMLASGRQVLLGVREDRVEDHALACAINLCKRVNAGLDILFVSAGDDLPARLSRFFNELAAAGIGYRLQRGHDQLGREISRHVRSRGSIAFVVIDSLESWGDDHAAEPWRELGCPLVVAARP